MLKDIIEVTTKLVEFADSFEQSGAKKRESIAKYFSRVSGSLKEVAKQLKAGELPYSEVAQLKELAEGLLAAIGEEIGKEQAIELSKLLRKSVGENLENLRNNEEAIRLIQESAGKFDGLAFRVGYSDSKILLVKPRVVALILLALVGITTWLVSYFSHNPGQPSRTSPTLSQTTTPSPSPSSTASLPSPIPAAKVVEALKIANITFDHPQWLIDQYDDYLPFANGCLRLLENRRLKTKIDLESIHYNYVEERGGKVDRDSSDGNLDMKILKESLIEAYNNRTSPSAQSFEDIVEPK